MAEDPEPNPLNELKKEHGDLQGRYKRARAELWLYRTLLRLGVRWFFGGRLDSHAAALREDLEKDIDDLNEGRLKAIVERSVRETPLKVLDLYLGIQVWRLRRGLGAFLLVSAIPSVLLYQQNRLVAEQTQLLGSQIRLAEAQNQTLERETALTVLDQAEQVIDLLTTGATAAPDPDEVMVRLPQPESEMVTPSQEAIERIVIIGRDSPREVVAILMPLLEQEEPGVRGGAFIALLRLLDAKPADSSDLSNNLVRNYLVEHGIFPSETLRALAKGIKGQDRVVRGAIVSLRRVEVSRLNMFDRDISGLFLTGGRFKGVSMTRVDLHDVALNHMEWRGCHLNGSTLTGASIMDTTFNNVTFEGVNFSNAAFSLIMDSQPATRGLLSSKFDECTIHSSDFTRADLSYATFVGCELKDINLTEAKLTEARFINVSFLDSYTIDANGTKVSLTPDHLRQRGAFVDPSTSFLQTSQFHQQ